MSLAQKLTAVAENTPKVYEAGKAWVFQHVTQPPGMFYKAQFPAGSALTVELPHVLGNLAEMFRLVSGLRWLKLTVPTDQAYRMYYLAYYSQDLEELWLPEGIRAKDFQFFASRCQSLRRVEGTLDLTESTNNSNCFSDCPALQEVRFAPGSIRRSLSFRDSDKLSAETVASILAGLGDVSDGETQTLQLHAHIRATLTADQLAAITAKNWVLE